MTHPHEHLGPSTGHEADEDQREKREIVKGKMPLRKVERKKKKRVSCMSSREGYSAQHQALLPGLAQLPCLAGVFPYALSLFPQTPAKKRLFSGAACDTAPMKSSS